MKKRKLKKNAKIFLFCFLIIIMAILSYFGYRLLMKKEERVEKMICKPDNITYGVFDTSFKKAKELVSNMSLEEKVGQLFLVRYYYDKINE